MHTTSVFPIFLLTVATTFLSSTYASNVSDTGSCGLHTNTTCLSSSFGSCCSPSSFCGSNSTYCGAGCQVDFGACYINSTNISPASEGTCGGASANQYTCLGSVFGNCCSGVGFCGGNETYCGQGCQAGYGVCGSVSEAAGVSVATTVIGGVATATATGSASASASASAEAGSGNSGLSSGAKAGIGVGVTVIALLIIGAVLFLVLKRRRDRTSRTPYQAELPSAGARKDEKQFRDGQIPPSEMGTEGAVGGHTAVELPTSASHAELAAGGGMTERERIVRVDDRVAAGYDGAYRGN